MRTIVCSQLFILIGVLGCVLIRPDLIGDNALSLYGTTKSTIIPYSIALAGSSIFIFITSFLLSSNPKYKTLRNFLNLFSAGLLAVLLTPNTVNGWFYIGHALASVYLFTTGLLIIIWLVRNVSTDYLDWLFISIQIIGIIIAILSLKEIDLLNKLALGQLMAMGAFGILIVRLLNKIQQPTN